MYVMPACHNAGDTIYFPFDAYDSNGASVTISGFAVTDIEVYKNGSTTQRSSDNGYALLDTDGIDFDGTTGLHGFSIDTSDNSDAGFWADGAQYWVNINAVTIDGQTVRFTYYLTLGYLLRPAMAGRKLVVDSAGLADANTVKLGPSGSGTAQTARDIGASVLLSNGTGAGQVKLTAGYTSPNWGDVGSPTSTVNLSNTTIKTASDLATLEAAIKAKTDQLVFTVAGYLDVNTLKVGGTTQTAGDLAALLATVASYIDTEVAAIKAKTDNLPSDPADASDVAAAISAAQTAILAKLPAALVSGRMDSSVGSMANNTLTAAALATDAVNEIVAAIIAAGSIAAALVEIHKCKAALWNKRTDDQANGTQTLYDDDDSTPLGTSTRSENASTGVTTESRFA